MASKCFPYVIAAVSLLVCHTPLSANDFQTRLKKAAALAAVFLKKKVLDNDYYFSCTASDSSTCPVHKVGHILNVFFISDAIGDDLSAEERYNFVSRIDAEDRGDVWGYSTKAPIDSDDTAFALRARRQLGMSSGIQGLLKFYIKDSNRFLTFNWLEESNRNAKLVFMPNARNNLQVHPEVAANIYNLFVEMGKLEMINSNIIKKSQAPEGYWRSFFYPGKYYSSYMYMNLLEKLDGFQSMKDKTIAYIQSRQNGNGSWREFNDKIYPTTLALNILACRGCFDSRFKAGIEFLLERQLNDGSWETKHPIWKYHYMDSPKVVWTAYDINRVMATALALRALKRYFDKKP